MRPREQLLQVHVLGPLDVIVAGRAIKVDTRKALAIVALIAADGRPFARDELAAMFWPDADDEAARGALRRTLSALKSSVGGEGLVIERDRVHLDPERTIVDLVELERLATSILPADLEAAMALARGPFLAGFAVRDSPDFDDWQQATGSRVDRLVSGVLDRLTAMRIALGDLSGAIDTARRQVALDPLDEVGQRRLMELIARSGDRSGAIRQYRMLVALFDRELGVGPLRETTELYESIREDRITVVAGSPPPGGSRLLQANDRPAAIDASPATTVVPVRPMLVGRDPELAAIAAAASRARPDGRIALIEGEAGIGKTRLVEAALDAVRSAGGLAIAASGHPGESGIPYGPIAGLLRAGIATTEGRSRLADLDETVRLDIGRVVDLPAEVRVTPGGRDAARRGARVRMLHSMTNALTELVVGSPSGHIWIDDLHHADDSTLELLRYLARRLSGRPVLLILSYRREDLSAEAEATVAYLAGSPDALMIELGRLDRAAIEALVREARPGFATTTDSWIDALVFESEGLPLHVAEVLASGDDPSTVMPGGVRALLRDRIASVGETAAQVLAAAAVLGRLVDPATVRLASGRSEEETVDALEELTRRGILRETSIDGTAPRYDFSHGNLRAVAYDGLGLARRRLLHRRAADALRLAPKGPAQDQVGRLTLIAEHEREAGRVVEAAAAYRDAAAGAEAVFANHEAIGHLEAALALDPPDGSELHARIAELQSRLGDYGAAIDSFEAAAALADPPGLGVVEIALGRTHRRRGDLQAAASHLDAALASMDLPPGPRVRALVERSIVDLRAGSLAEAAATADLARRAAAESGDPVIEGTAERVAGLVAHAQGDPVGARSALERAVALAARDPDPTAGIAAATGLAVVCAASGALEDALALLAHAIDDCQRIGDRHLEAAVENHLADVLHGAGQAAASMDHLKRAVTLFAEVDEAGIDREPGIWALAAW